MTKEALQQELKARLKEGVKPSHLKRSKSEGDIKAPPPPLPPEQLLQDQLKEKQKEIESLRGQLETVNQKLTETTAQLDNSLEARNKALKEWTQQQERIKSLEQELNENVDEASNELIAQDKTMVDLRTQVRKLQLTNQQLVKDLNLAQRAAGLQDYSFKPTTPNNFPFLASALTCLLIGIVCWLTIR